MGAWLSLLWVLFCVVVIIGLAYWVTKQMARRGGIAAFGAAKGTEQFQVLARLALGKEQMLVLVQAGERYFLLGVTQSAISTLAELDREEAQAWFAKQGEQAAPPSFREALQKVLQQRRQR